MKRLAFLVILVAVTASLTGCRRGFPLFGMRGNQCGSACAAPTPAYGGGLQGPSACECAPPAVSAPIMSAPMMMSAPATPGCNCGASATPMVGGQSFAVNGTAIGNGFDGQYSMLNGQIVAPSMNGLPIDGSAPMYGGTVYNNSIPNGTFGSNMNIIGDRVVQPGGMMPPGSSVKVGQKP